MFKRVVGDVVRRTGFPISVLVCLFIYFSRLGLYSPKIVFFFFLLLLLLFIL